MTKFGTLGAFSTATTEACGNFPDIGLLRRGKDRFRG